MGGWKASAVYDAGDFFQIFRDGVPRTRNELASMTGLSRPTVISRIDDLMGLDLVAAVSDAVSTGGRPSARIAFNPSGRLVVSADVGATHIHVGICDLSGSVLADDSVAMLVSQGPRPVLQVVVELATSLLESLRRDSAEVVAMGVGLPGPVDHATGRPTSPPIMPGWDGFDVPAHLRQSFDVPVLVDNDVNIMALGERALSWPDADDLIFVKAATGIGAGIISDGTLRRGAKGGAGDVGHVFVQRAAGLACRCGKTGCLEALAGTPAIVRALRDDGLELETGAEVVDLVRQGNLDAARHVRESGRAIGEMLNACVSILNPSIIVVGGQLAQSGESLLAGIREEVYSHSSPLATRDLQIAQSRSGSNAGILGAGILAIEHVLSAAEINAVVQDRQSSRAEGSAALQ
ncbi:ROK family protein [Herbiconiux sp.]|uniref:ROK family protein n=1 Tax=Herbiconiux sp. TaxID=1871186 RepID=UPI0025C2FE3E|nr:ROK family protein [Herbiconiux sp.]